MTLKNSLTGSKGDISSMFEEQAGRGGGGFIPIMRVPFPNSGVQASCADTLLIKSAGMALQGTQTLSSRDTPDPGGGIIACGKRLDGPELVDNALGLDSRQWMCGLVRSGRSHYTVGQ